MINWKNNFIFRLFEYKMVKVFSSRNSSVFYDRRIKNAFLQILKAPKPLPKFLFTTSTMNRVSNMDITHAYPETLAFLFNKYGSEVGVCISEVDNLAFIYCIGATEIKLIVTCGSIKSTKGVSGLMKTIIGSAIINYSLNSVSQNVNSIIGIGNYLLTNQSDIKYLDSNHRAEITKYVKSVENKNLPEENQNIELTRYNQMVEEDNKIKCDKLYLAIKMFIFLKTASVINKTFIAEGHNSFSQPHPHIPTTNNGITRLDSTWDSSVDIINPFSVRGHFRNQPKKNDEGKTYTELIYIDGFMKQGYHRKSGIEKHFDDLKNNNPKSS